MKLYFETLHSESERKLAVELFFEFSQRVKAIGYFRRRSPSLMFDRTLNATFPNTYYSLRMSEENLSTTGVTLGDLGHPPSLDTKHKNSKMKS